MNQSIHFDTMQNIFHLNTKNSSYIIKILKDGTLSHIYYGKRLRRYHGSKPFIFVDRGFSPNPTLEDSTFSYDTIPQEYPTNGDGDFRTAAYQTLEGNGSRISRFHFDSYEVIEGKQKLQRLPHMHAENKGDAETLIIHAKDAVNGLAVELQCTVFLSCRCHDTLR